MGLPVLKILILFTNSIIFPMPPAPTASLLFHLFNRASAKTPQDSHFSATLKHSQRPICSVGSRTKKKSVLSPMWQDSAHYTTLQSSDSNCGHSEVTSELLKSLDAQAISQID